jgi:hypothetical protein
MLIPRSRQCSFKSFVYQDSFSATYQNCTATLVMLNQICTWTAKTRAIPSLHRDSFSAKVPGLCPVLASGNATSLYCRAVRLHPSNHLGLLFIIFKIHNFTKEFVNILSFKFFGINSICFILSNIPAS